MSAHTSARAALASLLLLGACSSESHSSAVEIPLTAGAGIVGAAGSAPVGASGSGGVGGSRAGSASGGIPLSPGDPPAVDSGVAPPEDEPFFFVQLADTQFGMFENDASFEMETVLFEQAVGHVNRLAPAFVVVCGDLVNQVMNNEQRDEFWRIANTLDPNTELRLVAGNHDVGNVPDAESLAWYRTNFGGDWYTFTHRTSFFVVLNSSLIRDPDEALAERDAQRDWLTGVLSADGDYDHIFILQHHPWILQSRDEPDDYFNIPQQTREPYLELFEQHGVTAVFNGHYHRNSWAEANGIEYVTTGPVGKPLGEDDSGLRIVKVYADHLEHQYYEFVDVPDFIEL